MLEKIVFMLLCMHFMLLCMHFVQHFAGTMPRCCIKLAQWLCKSLIEMRMIGSFAQLMCIIFTNNYDKFKLPKSCQKYGQHCNQQLWWIQITKYLPNICPTFVSLLVKKKGKQKVCPTVPIVAFNGQFLTNNCGIYFAQQNVSHSLTIVFAV